MNAKIIMESENYLGLFAFVFSTIAYKSKNWNYHLSTAQKGAFKLLLSLFSEVRSLVSFCASKNPKRLSNKLLKSRKG